MKILIVGESCQDIFMYGQVKRLEPSAPVPVIEINKTVKNPGMAMNVAKNIESLNINYDILTNSNWKNQTKTRMVEENINHMFLRVDQEEKYEKFDRNSTDFSTYDAVIISDYNKGFLSIEDIEYICSKNNLVFLDTKKPLNSWAECARYIKINSAEHRNAEHITEELEKKLILTLGNKGASHVGKIYPVHKTEVKDLSGAGDTFLAGLVCRYIKSNNIQDSIDFANKCATKVVQKKGVSTV